METKNNNMVLLTEYELRKFNGNGKIAEGIGFILGVLNKIGSYVDVDQTTRWP